MYKKNSKINTYFSCTLNEQTVWEEDNKHGVWVCESVTVIKKKEGYKWDV